MRPSDEVHNYPRMLDRTLARIRSSSTCEENKQAILEFHEFIVAQGLSLARQTKYLCTLLLIAKRVCKSFHQLTKQDILAWVKSIETSSYTDWTKHDYKVILKIFYRWLRNAESYPEEVSWIRPRVRARGILPEELISMEEVDKLVQAAYSTRDKALILLLAESGCRVGEVLSLKIKHVSFDQYGAQIIVNGKTGSRRVRITACVPALSTWLDNHPLRDSPDSPLWVSTGTTNWGQVLNYSSALTMLKKLTSRAGLTKRIYPHLFRHSRATYLAKHVPEPIMKEVMGWVQSSKQSATYVHLSGRDVDREILKLQGIIMEENGQPDDFKVLRCARCGKTGSPGSKFCNSCGLPFDHSDAARIDELRQKADKLVSALIGNEDILDKLLNKIDELRSA